MYRLQRYGYPNLPSLATHAFNLDLTFHVDKSIVTTDPLKLHFLSHTTRGLRVTQDLTEVMKLLVFTEYPVPNQ